MAQKKSHHIMAVQQVIAQFQIQTQVKRITLQTMDKYMLGNKQAFNYIQECHDQQRLKHIIAILKQMQIQKFKLQTLQTPEFRHLQERFLKQAEQFWNEMKESMQIIQQMKKNNVNLVKESGAQSGLVRGLQREIKDLNLKIGRMQSQLHQQTYKLIEKIQQTKSSITLHNSSNRLLNQNLLQRLSKAKGQLDSRSETLAQLCKDIELYKNDKKTINSQILNLYEQLNSRVLSSEFNKIRIYIDNSSNVNFLRIQQVHKRLDQKIRQQSIQINRQLQEIIKSHKGFDTKIQQFTSSLTLQIQAIEKQNKQKHQNLKEQIRDRNTDQQQKNKQFVKRIQYCQAQLQILQNSFQQKLQRLIIQSESQKNAFSQFQSNINSINNLLQEMEKQNIQRGQQLAKLRIDSDSKGDIGQQVNKMAQKIMANDETIRDHKEKLLHLTINVSNNYQQLKNMVLTLQKGTSSKIDSLSQTQSSNYGVLSKKISQNHTSMQQKIEYKSKFLVKNFNQLIKQKLDSMKQKFNFLQTLSHDVAKFKRQYQEQLQMNSQLNKEIKQKMDRMFGMLTKIKADIFMKLQNLGVELNKSANKIKENSKNTAQLGSLLTFYNELINIIIAVNFSRQFVWDSQKQQLKQEQKQYKLSSILQGWILQVSQDKIKYRGQQTSRKALLQVCLQSHVKNGDKVKGGIIQNGKQVFNRISGSNQQYQQSRKRSLSRSKQRQSELPKVYR